MSEKKENGRCDYCNAPLYFNQDKMVKNYIPELRTIYCDKCVVKYDQRSKIVEQQESELIQEFVDSTFNHTMES